MLSSMSDKALIYEIKNGNIDALDLLAKRFGYPLADKPAVVSAMKRLRVPSSSAAKRIIAANAGVPA